MRISTRKKFSRRISDVKDIKNRLQKNKATNDLYEIINLYDTAVDLCYDSHVLDKITKAKTPIEAENILVEARRAS